VVYLVTVMTVFVWPGKSTAAPRKDAASSQRVSV
jgi:hypothetical protein